jgi:N utilization substance protein A
MEKTSISQAIKNICDEKGISYESVIETIESALAAAYRKDFGNKMQNIKIEFNPDTGAIKAYDVKTVVEDVPEEELEEGAEDSEVGKVENEKIATTEDTENTKTQKTQKTQKHKDKEESGDDENKKVNAEDTEVDKEKPRFNPRTMIQISEAQKIDKKLKVGDELVIPLEVPGAFGRMAAQTAKQVIIQKLREAERETLYTEYKEKEGEVLIGTIQRREGRVVLVDLGRATAIMLPDGQISSEDYSPGQHLKVYVVSVEKTTKGPEIIVSRSHPNIVKKLFETEIPEIANGTVVIKGVAREAGSRTKISVFTDDENIDPIGSCIGQRGARVQTIIAELKGEKIDIIQYSDDPVKYISNALSPAKIADIKIDEENRTAIVAVNEDQLSLAIGRAGQNVRLAAQLTGWKIDIVPASSSTSSEAKSSSGSGEGKEETKKEKVEAKEVSKAENKKQKTRKTQKTTEGTETKDEVKKVGKEEDKKKVNTKGTEVAEGTEVKSAKKEAGAKKGEKKEKSEDDKNKKQKTRKTPKDAEDTEK